MRSISMFGATGSISDNTLADALGTLVEDTLNTVSGELSLGNAALTLEDKWAADHLAGIRAHEAAQKRQKGH